MQGTQYAPQESILCMEHFVALHSTTHMAAYQARYCVNRNFFKKEDIIMDTMFVGHF